MDMAWVIGALAVLLGGATAVAQPEESTTAPAAGGEIVAFKVIGVEGNTRIAPSGTDPKLTAGWRRLDVGDRITRGQVVRVGIRAKVKIVADPATPPTVMVIEKGIVDFTDLHLKNGSSVVRLDMPYGSVKAGVIETETRSDLEIRMPTATLSKKGTDIFQCESRPNGRFSMALSPQGRGLLQAIQTQLLNSYSGGALRSRLLTPGQWVTQRMVRAIDNMKFDRNVSVNDPFGIQGADQLFTISNNTGFGFLLPAGNGNPVQGRNQEMEPVEGEDAGPSSFFGAGANQVRLGDFGIGQAVLPDFLGLSRRINTDRQQKLGAKTFFRPSALRKPFGKPR
jgi:hypothetical protein